MQYRLSSLVLVLFCSLIFCMAPLFAWATPETQPSDARPAFESPSDSALQEVAFEEHAATDSVSLLASDVSDAQDASAVASDKATGDTGDPGHADEGDSQEVYNLVGDTSEGAIGEEATNEGATGEASSATTGEATTSEASSGATGEAFNGTANESPAFTNTEEGQSTSQDVNTADSLPETYDARDSNLISPVRLQDPWGTCWAFAPLAAMEANLVKQGFISNEAHLSPRHLIYFAGTPVGDEAGSQAGEGQHPSEDLVAFYEGNAVFEMGGHALEVASAISSGEGVVFDTVYPYQNDEGFLSASDTSYATDGTWALAESARYDSAFALRNMHRLPNPGTFAEAGNLDTFELNYYALDAVKQAILDYGAVSVSYNSYRGNIGYSDHYDSFHHSYFTADSTRIDHDVCVVGWDDNYPRENFMPASNGALPEANGAWIVKNSWGALDNEFPNRNDWGDAGYFYLSYFDRSTTGFTAWEMMSLASEDATKITHQYDYMGQRSNAETRVASYAPTAAANVFTASRTEAVRAVSVNTYAPHTQVSISLYLLPQEGSVLDPTDGELLATTQTTCEWGGYHRITLDKEVLLYAGERFAVVVSCTETDADGNAVPVVSIEAGNNPDSMTRFGLAHYDTVICNEGETFILADMDNDVSTPSIWVDGTQFGKTLQAEARDSAYYGNANIKVFADPRTVLEPARSTTSGTSPEQSTPVAAPELEGAEAITGVSAPSGEEQASSQGTGQARAQEQTQTQQSSPAYTPTAISSVTSVPSNVALGTATPQAAPTSPRATVDTNDGAPVVGLAFAAMLALLTCLTLRRRCYS